MQKKLNKNVWVLRPGRKVSDGKEGEFEVESLKKNYVRVGWEKATGDIKDAKREDIKDKLKTEYPDAKERTIGNWAGCLFRFANEIHEGDIVFMPLKSDPKKVAKGIITGDYEFRDGKKHIHPVVWESKSSLRKDFRDEIQKRLGRPQTLINITHCFSPEEIGNITK